jgi:hypothetical protein
MTKTEIDVLWNRALREALEGGEEFTRYRFAAMVASQRDKFWTDKVEAQIEVEVAAEREACAKSAEDFLTSGRSPLGRSVADAIRARAKP